MLIPISYMYIKLVHSTLFCALFRAQIRGIQSRHQGTSASASSSPIGVGSTSFGLYYFISLLFQYSNQLYALNTFLNYKLITINFLSLIYFLFSCILNGFRHPSGVGQHVTTPMSTGHRGRGVSQTLFNLIKSS